MLSEEPHPIRRTNFIVISVSDKCLLEEFPLYPQNQDTIMQTGNLAGVMYVSETERREEDTFTHIYE